MKSFFTNLFHLLLSVFELMKGSHIDPLPDTITKLSAYLEPGTGKTRLDKGRLSQLTEVLGDFKVKSKVEDEVEFVSSTLPPVKPTKDDRQSRDVGPKKSYIQGTTIKQVKPSAQTKIPASYGGSSRASSSKFSEKDQQRLEAAVPQASFRKSQPVAGPSKSSVIHLPNLLRHQRLQIILQVNLGILKRKKKMKTMMMTVKI